ncbi:MAG: hypothetical protein Q8J78_16335 [Moraxellaceae bacterium]|nr:hypothetical protein [Moraxellaceae bacterium]
MARENGNLLPAGKPTWLLMGLVLAIISITYSVWERHLVLEKLKDQQHQQHVQSDRASSARLDRAGRQEVSPKVEQAVLAISQSLNTPWLQLMDAVQQAAGSEVTLSRVQSDAAMHLLIDGQAASVEAVLAYVERLKTQELFSDVDPVSVEPTVVNGVRFKVAVTWGAVNLGALP